MKDKRKTKDTSNYIKAHKEGRAGGFKKGHTINIGRHWKIKDTSKMLGNTNGFKKGHTLRKGMKNKIGQGFQKGSTNGFGKGDKHREESKQKNREWHIKHPNRKYKDTKIELLIEEELKRRSINYQKQTPLCKIALVDFYLPEYRIVIQCDGDYWHSFAKQKEKDEKQEKILTFNGFNVYRFWEHEINESPEECINKLLIYDRK